tara:strand:- start:305 stop:1102 length:798 start_codon:yes stop_codon:yes gene_type:complete
MKIVSFFLLFFLFVGCGNKKSNVEITLIDKQTEENLKLLYKSMSLMEIEVVYEPDAEPYVGNRPNGQSYWTILESNIKEVFKQREGEYSLVVPTSLDQMTSIPAQNKSSWTSEDLQVLESKFRKTIPTGSQASVFVVFLKGNYNQDGVTNPNIIGVSLAGTTLIAIFKDVVESASAGSPQSVAKFMEQSTLVHEFGHVVGLVDNGLNMSTPHIDEEHGHHCDNPNCVMFWKNEGKSNLILFVQQIMTSGSTVMFDQNCLEDTKNY